MPQRGIRWLPPGMAVPARTSGCLHGTVIGYPRALERAVPHGVVQRAQPRRIREPGHHSDEQRLRHHHRRKGPRPAPGDLCLETAVLIGRRGNGASDVAAMAALTQGEGGRVRRCRAGNAAGIVTVKSGPGTIHGSRKQGAFPFVGLPRPGRGRQSRQSVRIFVVCGFQRRVIPVTPGRRIDPLWLCRPAEKPGAYNGRLYDTSFSFSLSLTKTTISPLASACRYCFFKEA